MNIQTLFKAAVACVIVVSLTGCLGGQNVKRVSTDQEVALSDRWNDTDSSLVSEEMIDDMLSFPWRARFQSANLDAVPTITIHKVQNKSHEHIAVETFINDLKRSIIRSGKAEFIVGGAERDRVRNELKQQDVYTSEETRTEMGQEQGANFALSGTINSIVDQVGGTRVTFYQVDLKLIDLKTTREVWNGQKKIKKVMKKSRFGF